MYILDAPKFPEFTSELETDQESLLRDQNIKKQFN